jgi:hypothetical protein
MARFPQSPKIGQAFLSEEDLYVWSGYSWDSYSFEVPQYRISDQVNSSNYTSTFLYEYYGIGYTGGICSFILPLGNSDIDKGKSITVADEVGGISFNGRGISVTGSGGQIINGESSILMKINRMSLTFLFNGNSWKTI